MTNSSPTYSVAHLGNSIQYYNDCARLLETMLLSTALGRVADLDAPASDRAKVRQDSCLRGGATIPSLWEDGNGMGRKFTSRPESLLPSGDGDGDGDGSYDIGAPTVRDLLQSSPSGSGSSDGDGDGDGNYWDFLVVNDHTQSPVRSERKEASKAALEAHYLPAIAEGMVGSYNQKSNTTTATSTTTTTVVFVQTMAYKSPVKDSADLGSFDDFTKALIAGYEEYVELVEAFNADRFPNQEQLSLKATVAPLGRAYQVVREEHPELWSASMYANDDFHPSPHGTLLEACLLHCVVTGGQKFAFFDDSGGNNNNNHNNNNDDGGDDGDGDGSMETWWKRARYMQPLAYPNGDPQEPLRLPTRAEAVLLNDIAHRVYLERRETEHGTKLANNTSKL